MVPHDNVTYNYVAKVHRLLFFADPNWVHINVILQHLKLQEHLSHVSNEIIRSSINRLEDNSDIYETASKCYKIVN